MSMVNMEPTMMEAGKCDGLANRSGCYDIVVTDIMTNFWPTLDGRMPLDEPVTLLSYTSHLHLPVVRFPW